MGLGLGGGEGAPSACPSAAPGNTVPKPVLQAAWSVALPRRLSPASLASARVKVSPGPPDASPKQTRQCLRGGGAPRIGPSVGFGLAGGWGDYRSYSEGQKRQDAGLC